MKRNKKSLLLVLSLMSLVSCNGHVNPTTQPITENPTSTSTSAGPQVVDPDQYVENDPVLAPDSDFQSFDDINVYENKTRLPSAGGSTEVPDPFVYRFNGMYYLYSTTGGRFVKGYKSSDLIEWELVDNGELKEGYVYSYSDDPSNVKPADPTPFAPEVIYRNGKFYLIASPSGNGHYVLESDSPEGPFTCISNNIGKGIDGSYFIDKDENVYLYGSGLKIYAMEDDMKTVKKNDDNSDSMITLNDCRVGSWNEGPYMLLRNGQYYFTYCGTHYLSKSYRVDYAYLKEGADVMKNSSYKVQGNLLLSTADDFYGLGHSCMVLGPDMDSYYIAYHNLEGNAQRFLNFSRLSFNGSTMIANDVKTENVLGLDSCDFSTYGTDELSNNGNFLLSGTGSEETFTAEFNTVGEGKMIFSYIDEKNYSYMQFANNEISIYKIIDGVETKKHDTTLLREYDTSVIHTFRLQHHKGKVNLYFDGIEKESGLDIYFKGGKIGFEKNHSFDEVGYIAYSNVGRGSSDQKAFNSHSILANAYDEKLSYLTTGSELELVEKEGDMIHQNSYNLVLANKGDRATYRVYQEGGTYALNMRFTAKSIGKKIGVRLDRGTIQEYTITSNTPRLKNGDVLLTIDNVEMNEGQHYVSIYGTGDEVRFSEIYFEEASYDDDFSLLFDSQFSAKGYYVRNNLNLSDKGIHSDDQSSCGLITKTNHTNVSLDIDFNLNSVSNSGYISLLLNVKNYTKNDAVDSDGGDNNNTFQGYRLEFDGTTLYLRYVDYNRSLLLKSASVNYTVGSPANLKIVQEGNAYTAYFNDEAKISIVSNIGNLNGAVGVLMASCNAYVEMLSVVSK